MNEEEIVSKSDDMAKKITSMFYGIPLEVIFRTLESCLISLYIVSGYKEEDSKKRINHVIETSFKD